MKFLKAFYKDMKERIFENPKSTTAGVMAIIGYVTSIYGFAVPPIWIATISTVLLAALGLGKKDASS